MTSFIFICGYELPANLQNFTQKDFTEIEIFQKVLWEGLLFKTLCRLEPRITVRVRATRDLVGRWSRAVDVVCDDTDDVLLKLGQVRQHYFSTVDVDVLFSEHVCRIVVVDLQTAQSSIATIASDSATKLER